jgi:LAO/AO transport system kinase
VGAGQGEVGVRGPADTVLLVVMPGSGDAVQALKAGIMEIPDLIAVNKRDLPGAEATAGELRSALALAPGEAPEVLLTEALRREGTGELWTRIEERRLAALADGSLARRRGDSLAAEAVAVAAARAHRYLENALGADPALAALLAEVRSGRLDPLSAADRILRYVFPLADHDDPHPR